MSDLSPAFQKKLEESMQGLIMFFASFLNQACEQGELPVDLDVEETASFLVQAWHGALIRMKTLKSGRPLETCRKIIFGRVLSF